MEATQQQQLAKRELRDVLGTFATGVTIVTAWDEGANAPVGVTASSFNSVSLDPPLVLWSVGKQALSADVLTTNERFAIHVLNAEQTDLANRFAKSGTDKFGPTDYARDTNGVPVLPDFASRFDCQLEAVHKGGDHLIIVGRVMSIERGGGEPLVFHDGGFATAVPLELLAELKRGA
jgi:flavin reductase (DIM6/NTAB) family NADH-FMN oxidoreductase RutF